MSDIVMRDEGVGAAIRQSGDVEAEQIFMDWREEWGSWPILRKPVEALDLVLDYWRQCGTISHLQRTKGFLYAYENIQQNGGRRGLGPTVVTEQEVRRHARMEERIFEDGTPIFVTADVAWLTEEMGLAMPPDILRETDIPMPCGVVVFASRWGYLDFTTKEEDKHLLFDQLPIRAISWRIEPVGQLDGSSKPGVMMRFYSDIPKRQKESQRGNTAPLFMVESWPWTFDTWWQEVDYDEAPDSGHAHPQVSQMRRKLLCLWRFMQEEIVSTQRHAPGRAALRRWQHQLGKPPPSTIVGVHLRRYQDESAFDHPGAEEGFTRSINWTHRWWVSGHRRFNPKTGKKDIWVRPYVKGPEEKPLVLKTKLVSVDR